MGVKFFGQFLIEQGEVDSSQLREALDLLARTNRSVGQIAVAEGMLTQADAERVHTSQRNVDKPWWYRWFVVREDSAQQAQRRALLQALAAADFEIRVNHDLPGAATGLAGGRCP